jgi:uncharacterized protein (TIGR00269 family)
MKCKKCGRKAIAKLKQYGIALCEKCYPEFYKSLVERSIKKFEIVKKGEKVLAAVSGGKDSVAMISVLANLSENIGFDVEMLHIDLGISSYSKKSRKVVEELSATIDVPLHVVELKQYGFTIDDVSAKKVCSVCGTSKRYLMNRFAREHGFDVVATGHTSEDIVVFFFKNWLSGNFQWSEKLLPRTESFDEKIVTKVRPLFDRSEKENMLYVLTSALPYVEEECPYAPLDEWKEIVYDIEAKKPGFKRGFVLNLVKYVKGNQKDEGYRYCVKCGEVSISDVCAFCKAVERFKK